MSNRGSRNDHNARLVDTIAGARKVAEERA
jgi:hypothetical protein